MTLVHGNITKKGGVIVESILQSIKKLLGIASDYDHFDTDIIIHINSVFMYLNQLGVGPSEGFYIKDKSSLWTDFVQEEGLVEAIKTYMYLRVKLFFDPPNNSSLLESMNKQIGELEWRINVAVDNKSYVDSSEGIDYRTLKNLPSINGVTLIDNYDEQDPNIETISPSTVKSIWNNSKE